MMIIIADYMFYFPFLITFHFNYIRRINNNHNYRFHY